MGKTKLVLFSLVMTVATWSQAEIIQTPNGSLNQRLMLVLKPMLGQYPGKLDRSPGSLRLSVKSDRPLLSWSSSDRPDFLGENCKTNFGLLTKIDVRQSGGGEYIRRMFFTVNTNCKIPDRQVTITFSDKKMTSELIIGSHLENICHPGSPGPGGQPTQECHLVDIRDWLVGRFQKSSLKRPL